MSFVEGLDVFYGKENQGRALNGRDINAGYGGEFTYLIERRTNDPDRAARSFSIAITDQPQTLGLDLAKGAGGKFRYLITHNEGGQPIKRVFLSEAAQGHGHTEDINRGRGGGFLYLCWEF